jgi:hypothetical protein
MLARDWRAQSYNGWCKQPKETTLMRKLTAAKSPHPTRTERHRTGVRDTALWHDRSSDRTRSAET